MYTLLSLLSKKILPFCFPEQWKKNFFFLFLVHGNVKNKESLLNIITKDMIWFKDLKDLRFTKKKIFKIYVSWILVIDKSIVKCLKYVRILFFIKVTFKEKIKKFKNKFNRYLCTWYFLDLIHPSFDRYLRNKILYIDTRFI